MNSSTFYSRYLLLIAGLGGLLYGIDVGIIDPALGYLGKCISLSESEKSLILAAVLGGSMVSSLVAGIFADLLGRKKMMLVSAFMFVGSIAIIYLSQSYLPLLAGRILQGMSGGVIAVVVPLYLAECLPAKSRGKGTAIFQFLLTFGIVVAAFVGNYYTRAAENAIASAAGDGAQILNAADHAWRGMFLTVGYPGAVFLLGIFLLSESPRWLCRKGRRDEALRVMLRSRSQAEAGAELSEIEASLKAERDRPKVSFATSLAEIFSTRKYVLPFVIACIILGCNQATGINTVLGLMSTILQQAGMGVTQSGEYGTFIKILNCVMTIVAIALVDRKGRRFLLKLGTGGIIVALLVAAGVFYSFESKRVDVAEKVSALVANNELNFNLNEVALAGATATAGNANAPVQLALLYRYGGKDKLEIFLSNNEKTRGAVHLAPAASSPNTTASGGDRLEIRRAYIGPVPSAVSGYVMAACLALFIAFFAIGPGVCVWLALSELMPTRIRSVGMGIALVINQGTSTLIAATFLPLAGGFGYHAMFVFWALCTVVYFLTVTFLLPETKGRTLEEIEEHFEGKRKLA